MSENTPGCRPERQFIEAYGAGQFRIGGVTVSGSVIVFPDHTTPWTVSAYEDISAEALSPVADAHEAIEVLLIGCGGRIKMPHPEIKELLSGFGIVPDWMDTGAACRTFNVLVSEDRAVAAALISV